MRWSTPCARRSTRSSRHSRTAWRTCHRRRSTTSCEFEAKGYITLEPDPDDGRAKRIVLTDRGWAFGQTVEQLSRAISRRWAAEVGHERYAIFEDVLQDIAIKARARPDPPANPYPAEPPARPAHKAPETPAT